MTHNALVPCYYCGLPAAARDHITPRCVASALGSVADSLQTTPSGATVPTCTECNSALGDKVFATAREKKTWIKAWLSRHYERILSTPEWSESQLAQMEFNLQQHIRTCLNRKALLKARIDWASNSYRPLVDRPSYPKPVRITLPRRVRHVLPPVALKAPPILLKCPVPLPAPPPVPRPALLAKSVPLVPGNPVLDAYLRSKLG